MRILGLLNFKVRCNKSGFGGLGVSVLASGTQVRGFKSGRSRRIFKGVKILSTRSFGREVNRGSHVANLRHIKDP
jgi:hypothetical protein